MLKARAIFDRYWSLGTALVLPMMEILAERVTRGLAGNYEVARAILSVACIALLIHSWFKQRMKAKGGWQLGFFTLLLSLLALGSIRIGLNVIRADSYDLAADYQAHANLWYHNLYWNVVDMQGAIVLLAKVLGAAVVLWAVAGSCMWLNRRTRRQQ